MKKIEMHSNTFIYLSYFNKRKNTMSASQNMNTVAGEAVVSRKSIIVERLCALFGKSYDEIINAIQDEMTAMDLELQQWKLQVSEEPQIRTKPETKRTAQKAKKEPAKPRAKKGAAAATAESDEAVDTVTTADETIVSEAVAAVSVVLDEKKTKAPAKPRAKKSTDEAAADDLGSKPTTGIPPNPFFYSYPSLTILLIISSISYTSFSSLYLYIPPSNFLSISFLSVVCISQYSPFFAFLLHLPPFRFSPLHIFIPSSGTFVSIFP